MGDRWGVTTITRLFLTPQALFLKVFAPPPFLDFSAEQQSTCPIISSQNVLLLFSWNLSDLINIGKAKRGDMVTNMMKKMTITKKAGES